MKSTLRKKSKKIINPRVGAKERDLLILFVAVLTLFFAFLSSIVLGSIIKTTKTLQARIERVNGSIDAAELRINNVQTIQSINSLNKR